MEDNSVRKCGFVRVLDGDTFEALIELAPRVKPRPLMSANIRVKDYSAAELREPEGPYMRDQFERALKIAGRITIRFHAMSFERIVCDVYLDGQLFAGILKKKLAEFRERQQP